MDSPRTPKVPAVTATVLIGMATFIGLRWSGVMAEAGVDSPEVWWFVLPLAASYFGAAAMGMILVRDGVTRWWWLPALLFVAIGLPVEGWVTGSNILTTRTLPVAGSVVDLIAVLAPAAVLLGLTRTRRAQASPGRLVPVIAVAAVSVTLAMLVGQTGPDVSISVGVALLVLGVLSQSSSWLRALSFVAIAIVLGAQIPASLANAISQGDLGVVAIRDASMEIVVACLCFSIAALSRAWSRLLSRQGQQGLIPGAKATES